MVNDSVPTGDNAGAAPVRVVLAAPSASSGTGSGAAAEADEDEYDARIRRTGCYREHMAMLDCHFATKDWRQCRDEMRQFRECFDRYQARKDAETAAAAAAAEAEAKSRRKGGSGGG
ncbi:hypothetical protein HK405_007808, partial [Cladochytrium tenue]